MSYVNPRSILAIGIVFPVLGTIAVILRFTARLHLKSKPQKDDWLIVPAWLCMVGIGIALIYGNVKKVIGYPTPPSPDKISQITPQIALSAQVEWAILILQTLSLGFAKLSIIFFYRRIFCTGATFVLDIITKIFIGIIIAWTLSFMIAMIFVCGVHPSAIWGPYSDFQKMCDNGQQMNLGYTISDLIVDLAIFCMPIVSIWRLHLSLSKRLAVIFIFSLGALTLIASILRAVVFGMLLHNILTSLDSQDRDLDNAIFLYWTTLETGLAVIVACLPTLQTLLRSRSLEKTRFDPLRRDTSTKSHENNRVLITPKSSSSLQGLHPNVTSTIETYAMADLESQYQLCRDKVYVHTTVSQVEQGRC